MKVAAVIPHWNRAELLRTLLDNLRLQSRPFDEVLVVDNGSTDGSAELAEQAGARVLRLDRNYGFAIAVNRGFQATQADWVAILNNDVTLDPAWLERLLTASMSADDVRAAALAALEQRREEFLTEYTRRFGNILNADHAAELFPEYALNLETRARFRVAVHPAAQWIRDELFERALADPRIGEVIFTAGGNGAGKTSGAPRGDIIYDSTLNNVDHAERCISRCLLARKTVVVAYTYRPIREAFLGILHRAASQGRTVAIDTVIRTHTESAKTSALLMERFAHVPAVSFRFMDNTAGGPYLGDVALTEKENYASKRDELYRLLESQRGRIAEHLYAATAGSKAGSPSGSDRTGNPGESPQARAGQSAAATKVAFATGKILSARNPSTIDGAWDEVSRAACPVRIGAGAPDGPEWNTRRSIRMASMTACLVRRSAWMPLDERFGSYLEDVDFGLRCAKAGLEGVYEPTAVAYHLGSSTWGRWNPDTVRLLSRNQVLLAAKHFRGQPRRPILAGQLLWGLVALRHGCGWAWFRGKLQGLPLAPSFSNETPDAASFTALVHESEAEILAHQHELYWRVYSWLAPR